MSQAIRKSQQKVRELVLQVLQNPTSLNFNDELKLIIDRQELEFGEMSRVSQVLAIDVIFLLQHLNRLCGYLQILQSMIKSQQSSVQNYKIVKRSSKILRMLGLLAYTHPVFVKKVQSMIRSYEVFSSIDFAHRFDLETLNILCLIPSFNYDILHLEKKSFLFKDNSYENALWLNVANILTYSEFYQQWKAKVNLVEEGNVVRMRDFVNILYQLNTIVRKVVYPELGASNEYRNAIKMEQSLDEHSYIQQQKSSQNSFSELEIFLSFHNFITLEYLPESFITANQQYIQIWIDRTVEVNSLMGNFICKQKLGEFQYVKGPLLYAIQKGIFLILNNFEQISHQLLVTMRTLATRNEINHNQKTIHVRSGFKIIGICSQEGRKKAKSLQNSASIIPHFELKPKTISDYIPFNLIKNEANIQFINEMLQKVESYGLKTQVKLWKRMTRLRKRMVNLDQTLQNEQKIIQQLWNGYITQSFKDEAMVEIQQLTNQVDYTRNIEFHREYKTLKIGRCELALKSPPSQNIVPTQYSLRILQRLAICQEPQINQCPLLISETGCGKTTLVQYLAEIANKKLYVYNMSSGTDVSDLVGGFKPIDCRVMLKQLFYTFTQKFVNEIPGAQKNKAYINSLITYYEQGKLQVLLKSLIQSIPKIKGQVTNATNEDTKTWDDMHRRFSNILANLDKIDSNLVFSFMEGNLVTALKNGDWVLIDEINLATNDVLQKIVPLVQGKSILLYQKGDLTHITRNQGFKIIGCMNPATDSGKKPLPPNLHDKFTAINLSQPSRNDIQMMISTLCPQLKPQQIADIYFEIKKTKTVSLRNLSRSLAYINKNREVYGWQRAMYDGLMLGYGEKDVLAKYKNEVPPKEKEGYKLIHGFLMEEGPIKDQKVEIFHLTKTFSQHLNDFLRAIAGTQLPVLLQGPTSAGKTSIIKYVAQLAGHKCIRINNHEHTQIEEYLGNYFPDKQGKLVFRQGPLVTAVRQGHWLTLDELNLAKTQILQCLNRLLDDNRELFIPEQQKHIKPHKNFRIFATQNPSSYSGRKKLSRAFRNRFISLMFTDITVVDTMAILQARRPLVGDSKELSNYIKKVLEALINYRQRQKVFSKDGLITMRDLLKWTGRKFVNKELFIIEGYGILAERLRTIEEKQHVFNVLAAGSKITYENIYAYYDKVVEEQLGDEKIKDSKIYVQMNKSFRRMSALTYLGIESNQAILLVGETGCGKTTLAELLSYVLKRPFYSINCHKHTQASDLLGSLRPSSDPNSTSKFQFVNGVVIEAMLNGGILLIDEINTAEDSVLERLNEVLESNTIGVERGSGWESIKAKEGFCIIATMNPSGDYGKKQLSPALRNRFTQIWVQPITHPLLIVDAKSDILLMIQTKLNHAYSLQINSQIASLIYEFMRHYNCQITVKYNLSRKRMTMRDIGWMCKFITESKKYFGGEWSLAYFWALNILAIEGLNFMISDQSETVLLKEMKKQLIEFIASQCEITSMNKITHHQIQVISILKDMDFPLMIKTDLPLDLIGLKPDARIFFSSHTDLSDLLGQYQPIDNSFVWRDQELLKRIRNGGRTALMDLNLAQQQVIEGVNSLFDYRGSIFVVELNETVKKHEEFKPMVVLKYTAGSERKGLPNSFLNRFVKVCIADVSLETKINYLKSKYSQVGDKLIELLSAILTKQKNYPIERLQLLCQVCMKSPIQLSTCIDFLELKQVTNVDKFLLINNSQLQSEAQMYEEGMLSLLPLVKEYNLSSLEDIENVKKINIIYSLSNFSACVIGNCQKRDQMVEILAYLLNKKTTKIILSTMTDMNDLLGSYQQVTQSTQHQQSMQQQRSLQNAFTPKQSQNTQGKKTKFVYQQSAIVKALNDESSLLYIEVPNEVLLERVEKGLIELYQQRRQIIVGIDSMRETKTNTTKFIPIRLTTQPHQLHIQQPSLKPTLINFTQNMSHLTHLNHLLRKQQLHSYLEQLIRNSSSRPNIMSYKKMVVENQQSSINYLKTQLSLEEKEVKYREKKIRELPFKYTMEFNTQMEEIYAVVKRRLVESQAVDFAGFKQRSIIKSFMGISLEQINRKSAVYGKWQEKLLQIIQKYQVLFICNINDFQSTSIKILNIIFSPKLSLQESNQMLQKFSKQIDRLYDQLFRDKITQVVIKFNKEETRVIPILSNLQTVKYTMRENSLSLRIMADVTPKYSLVLANGIEKKVTECIETLRVNFEDISQWVIGMRLKDLKSYDIFEEKIRLKDRLLLDYKQLISLCNQLWQTISIHTMDQQISQKQSIIFRLISLFQPSKSLAINISMHIKSQIQYQTIKQVIAEDQTYLKCYKEICQVKYLGLETNKFKLLNKSIEKYQERLRVLAKGIVYRGHDNVKSLMEFYEYFMMAHGKIVQSEYDPQVIRQVIVQSYDSFYDTFSDILLPYYLPILAIYIQKSSIPHDQSLTLNILSQEFSQNSIFQFIQKIIDNQNQQIDRAKDYIRYQRKFNKTVIVDEYTQEGVQKNKQNLQDEFNELFGKNETDQSGNISQVDQLFYLLNKDTQNYYNLLCTKLNHHSNNYNHMIISLALTTTNTKLNNIYEQRNTDIIKQLIKPIPKMLHQVHLLMGKYKIDTLKALAGLLGKLYEHKAFKDQVYKVLVDCQYIIEKSFELNSILPAVERVPCDQLIAECLKLRRLELKNWKSMLYYKQQRTQKSDTINLIEFYKTIKQVQTPKQAFAVAQSFLRQSTISCLPSRMYFLDMVARSLVKDQKVQISIYRVMGFYEYLMPHVNEHYMTSFNGKVAQMKEYEKLAGWSSNEYLIFKATCEKFQRKIHHILRKFDDELSMTMAMLIQDIKTKEISSSIDEFQTKAKKDLSVIVEEQPKPQEDQGQQANQQVENNDDKNKKNNKKTDKQKISKKNKQTQPVQQAIVAQINNQYQDIIKQLFECIKQLSQGYQNSQSKLRIIRLSLQQLQDILKDKKKQLLEQNNSNHNNEQPNINLSNQQQKFITREMFQSEEEYKKGTKYYYGLWDKLCQRQENTWNRQVVERVWAVAETIWQMSNAFVPRAKPKSPQNQLVQDLKVLYKPYVLQEINKDLVSNKYIDNPIFVKQLQNVKHYILSSLQEQFSSQPCNKLPTQTQSLIKLGYLISSIALNLQKNGLCVKQDDNQDQQSGTEQVGDGMGIGQGEIHDAAQNVGDQIQFEQQVQGNKDEEKAQQDQDRDNKQQQNDIEMQGDFDGQMYDKQKPQQGKQDQQAQQQISNQQMGQVDNDKRQQDIKNQQGQAQGKGQADVDIDGQQDGQEDLVDNQREKDKEQRKKQQNRENEEEDEQEEQERSDWEDNNEQGQKINKQNENVEEHERDEDNLRPQKQLSVISGQQEPQNSGEQQEGSGESVDQQDQQMDAQNQSNSKEQNQNQDGKQHENQQIQIQNSQQPIEQEKPNQPQEQKQKKQAKNRKQYECTYGRQDNQFQNNNLVHNQQNNPDQNLGQGEENAQGTGEGQKGAGKSVHSLREQFLQEIMNKQNQSKGNQEFHKNLDVRIQEQDDEDVDQDDGMDAEEQQYALTEDDKKVATNLGMMDLEEKQQEQEKKQKEKQQRERNAQEKKQQQNQAQKPNNQMNNKKKPSQKDSKNNQLTKQDQVQNQKTKTQTKPKQQDSLLKQQPREPTKSQKKKQNLINLVNQQQESLIKAAVSSLSNNNKMSVQQEFADRTHLITESFLLSKILEEQLKSVLEPLDQAQYKGDYKTGKKLNLKKIIPFIASNYKKDRIWLRRTEPSQRNYHIMLALDDTKSMHYGDVGQQALKGLLSISLALQHLNIKTCITSIKDSMEVCKNFNDLLNCQKILQDFSFQYESSNSHDLSMSSFMVSSLNQFEKVQAADANGQSRQLCIIISDGKMNKNMVKPFLKEAAKKGITYVFIVIDSQKNSILNIKAVEYVNGKMEIKSYMSDFPFDFFLIINNAKELGDILGATLMQFIQEK